MGETFDRLRTFHRKAPFLFFNGNTFATIGRELSFALFSDLVPGRKREVGSAVAHYIAGVLDREAMAQIVETLSRSADLKPGEPIGNQPITASSERPVAAIDDLPSAIPNSANRSRIRYFVSYDIATRNGCGKRRVRG